MGTLPVPWQEVLLSIGVYVAFSSIAGFPLTKTADLRQKERNDSETGYSVSRAPVTNTALLATLVLLFSFKGETIVEKILAILWIAVPLFIRTVVIFALGSGLAKTMGLTCENSAPTAMIGASNHFAVAIAMSTILYGLSSGAALATVVGVLIEVPLMLMPVKFCVRRQNWFPLEQSPEAAGSQEVLAVTQS